MEYSLRLVMIAMVILVVVVVVLMLISNWSGQSSSAIDGLFKFFNSLLGGKTVTPPSMPSIPTK